MSLQKEIEKQLGVKPPIKTGRPGDLKVVVDGTSVFEYKQEGKLPPFDELVRRIQSQSNAGSSPN